MVANISNALSAYANAATSSGAPGMAPRDEGGPSFSELLQEAGKTAIETMKHSEKMTAEAVVGQADLTEVISAVTNAEVTLQTVTAVRDKVVTAYQEILRMPI